MADKLTATIEITIMQIQPYLFFSGNCEQAINFYAETLGAEIVMVMRYKDMPEEAKQGNAPQDVDPDAIMHAHLKIGGSAFMASDGCSPDDDTKVSHKGFSLSLNPHSAEEGQRLFDKLAAGGVITMPYSPTFWAKGFGMLTDKFGVNWMINVE